MLIIYSKNPYDTRNSTKAFLGISIFLRDSIPFLGLYCPMLGGSSVIMVGKYMMRSVETIENSQ